MKWKANDMDTPKDADFNLQASSRRKFPYKCLTINFHQKLNQQRDTAPWVDGEKEKNVSGLIKKVDNDNQTISCLANGRKLSVFCICL